MPFHKEEGDIEDWLQQVSYNKL